MPGIVYSSLPCVRAAEDLDKLIAAVAVHLLDAPIVANDAVAADLCAESFGHREIIAQRKQHKTPPGFPSGACDEQPTWERTACHFNMVFLSRPGRRLPMLWHRSRRHPAGEPGKGGA